MAAKPASASNVGSEPEAKKAVVVDTPAMDPVAAKPAPASNAGSEPQAKKEVVADNSAMDPVAAKPAPVVKVESDLDAKKAVVADTPAMEPVAAKPVSINKIAPPVMNDPVAYKSSMDPIATKADPNEFFAELSVRSTSMDPVASRPPAGMDKLLFGFAPEEFSAGGSVVTPLAEVPKSELVSAEATDLQVPGDQASARAVFEDAKTEKGEPLAKLQSVTSIFKSVFKGDKKDEVSFLSESEAGPATNKAQEQPEPELAMSGDKPKETQPKEVKNDIEGRMRRRSRRRN
ncbi:hypothetical protein [Shewanella sp.]|uniref:hypothetical protein n=1 Tax=Shewanella sp. TaxID=50422 RepID=UPI00356620B2